MDFTAPLALESDYLPAELSSPRELAAARAAVESSLIPKLFGSYPEFTMVLDRSRRIVWANTLALETFGIGLKEAIGCRTGEAIGCVHWSDTPCGCGTGNFCHYCGSATCLERSIAGVSSTGECMIRRGRGEREESLDLLVWSEPLELDSLDLILFAARDISSQKRREVLERVFYHDIANTVTGIQCLAEMLQGAPGDEARLAMLRSGTTQLIEEIESHRALKAAEEDSLPLNLEPIDGRSVLEEAVAFFAFALYGKDLRLSLDPSSDRPIVETDHVLLKRVFINMIKNAIEASRAGENVDIRCSLVGDRAVFAVHNAAVIPKEAMRRIFLRSYSTKGLGRGIGTYGMKLLGERYLGGKVSFSSREGEGTTFVLSLPLAFASQDRIPTK